VEDFETAFKVVNNRFHPNNCSFWVEEKLRKSAA